MIILDFLACFAGVCLGWILHCCVEVYLKKREEEWPYAAIFISPKTGTSYAVRKNKKGKYRCYINGVRVPNKWVLSNGNT